MEVVIKHFYNTINVNHDRLLDDFDDYDEEDLEEDHSKYEVSEIMKKARELGVTVNDLSVICNLPEEVILKFLNA